MDIFIMILMSALHGDPISAISTNHVRAVSPRDYYRNGPLPPDKTNWDVGLKEATYQALLREQITDPHLKAGLYAASIEGYQDSATPFGDIAVIARGQIYSTGHGYHFIQDPYRNDCDDCHNSPLRCDRSQCEPIHNLNLDNLLALWTVKRIRHRDPQFGHKYELQFTISPMSPAANAHFVTRNGRFDYNVPGHVFIVKLKENGLTYAQNDFKFDKEHRNVRVKDGAPFYLHANKFQEDSGSFNPQSGVWTKNPDIFRPVTPQISQQGQEISNGNSVISPNLQENNVRTQSGVWTKNPDIFRPVTPQIPLQPYSFHDHKSPNLKEQNSPNPPNSPNLHENNFQSGVWAKNPDVFHPITPPASHLAEGVTRNKFQAQNGQNFDKANGKFPNSPTIIEDRPVPPAKINSDDIFSRTTQRATTKRVRFGEEKGPSSSAGSKSKNRVRLEKEQKGTTQKEVKVAWLQTPQESTDSIFRPQQTTHYYTNTPNSILLNTGEYFLGPKDRPTHSPFNPGFLIGISPNGYKHIIHDIPDLVPQIDHKFESPQASPKEPIKHYHHHYYIPEVEDIDIYDQKVTRPVVPTALTTTTKDQRQLTTEFRPSPQIGPQVESQNDPRTDTHYILTTIQGISEHPTSPDSTQAQVVSPLTTERIYPVKTTLKYPENTIAVNPTSLFTPGATEPSFFNPTYPDTTVLKVYIPENIPESIPRTVSTGTTPKHPSPFSPSPFFIQYSDPDPIYNNNQPPTIPTYTESSQPILPTAPTFVTVEDEESVLSRTPNVVTIFEAVTRSSKDPPVLFEAVTRPSMDPPVVNIFESVRPTNPTVPSTTKKKQFPDSINAQLPPPDKGTDTTVPYVASTAVTIISSPSVTEPTTREDFKKDFGIVTSGRNSGRKQEKSTTNREKIYSTTSGFTEMEYFSTTVPVTRVFSTGFADESTRVISNFPTTTSEEVTTVFTTTNHASTDLEGTIRPQGGRTTSRSTTGGKITSESGITSEGRITSSGRTTIGGKITSGGRTTNGSGGRITTSSEGRTTSSGRTTIGGKITSGGRTTNGSGGRITTSSEGRTTTGGKITSANRPTNGDIPEIETDTTSFPKQSSTSPRTTTTLRGSKIGSRRPSQKSTTSRTENNTEDVITTLGGKTEADEIFGPKTKPEFTLTSGRRNKPLKNGSKNPQAPKTTSEAAAGSKDPEEDIFGAVQTPKKPSKSRVIYSEEFDIFGDSRTSTTSTPSTKQPETDSIPKRPSAFDEIFSEFGSSTENSNRLFTPHTQLSINSSDALQNARISKYLKYKRNRTSNFNKFNLRNKILERQQRERAEVSDNAAENVETKTSQSFITSISFKVNKNKNNVEVTSLLPIVVEDERLTKGELDELEQNRRELEENGEKRLNFKTTSDKSQTFDDVAQTLVNHARIVSYLNQKTTKPTRRSYKPTYR